MTLGYFEQDALKFEGFNDAQIAQIAAILPTMQHLAEVVKTELPNINKVIPVIAMMIEQFNAKQKEVS